MDYSEHIYLGNPQLTVCALHTHSLALAVNSLANHVPSVESLKSGVLEVIEGNANESKKWFGTLPSLLTTPPSM